MKRLLRYPDACLAFCLSALVCGLVLLTGAGTAIAQDAMRLFGTSTTGRAVPIGATTDGLLKVTVQTLTASTTQVCTPASVAETDLWTYSLPAATLSTDNRGVRVTAFGTYGANANGKTARVYFGATVVATLGGSPNSGQWTAQATVLRTSATAQVSGSLSIGLNGTSINSSGTTPAETLANAVTIKVTGQSAVGTLNDICFRGVTVEPQ